jgi:hypothetical protein
MPGGDSRQRKPKPARSIVNDAASPAPITFQYIGDVGGGVNLELIRAIRDKRLIEFTYKSTGVRIAEPHDYGIRDGNELLLAFQLSGDSRTRTGRGWKHLQVNEIRDLRILNRRFPGSRADRTQHHRSWDVLFARVE